MTQLTFSFICGGAFDGLEKIIEARMDQSTIGFNSQIKDKTATEDVGEMFHKALPQDLIKFGLIPEFVGRVPVVVALDSLDEESLVRILREPKNAILKQYKALLSLMKWIWNSMMMQLKLLHIRALKGRLEQEDYVLY